MILENIYNLIFEINNTQDNLIVIIKGNSKIINNPKIKDIADKFYNEIADILTKKGYTIRFRSSNDFVLHNKNAIYWIAHSKGCGTWDFRNKKLLPQIKRICITTLAEDGYSLDHYKLSEKDRKLLEEIPDVSHKPS